MNKSNIIVGFTGKAGSGKDTLANFIKDELNNKLPNVISTIAFADPIKHAIQAMFGIFRDELEFNKRNNIPLLDSIPNTIPRKLMTSLGTDWGLHMIHEDLWVELYKKKVSALKNRIIFTPDVRFHNEYEFIKSNPTNIIIKVHRDNIESIDHESEKNDIPYDIIVYNNQNGFESLKKIAGDIANDIYEVYEDQNVIAGRY